MDLMRLFESQTSRKDIIIAWEICQSPCNFINQKDHACLGFYVIASLPGEREVLCVLASDLLFLCKARTSCRCIKPHSNPTHLNQCMQNTLVGDVGHDNIVRPVDTFLHLTKRSRMLQC